MTKNTLLLFLFILHPAGIGRCREAGMSSGPERLRVSRVNPHLLETADGTPVFVNNFTLWRLIENGRREDVAEVLSGLAAGQYNMVSCMILGIAEWRDRNYAAGISPYGVDGFATDARGVPDPSRPIVTPGNSPHGTSQYDFWDHVDYVIDVAAANGLYIALHPAWGNWFSGHVHGRRPGDVLVFDEAKAYKYGNWLGRRFGGRTNILWMLGGDRSALYDAKTKFYARKDSQDYRSLYRAMAEGLADGIHGVDEPDGRADYRDTLISFHPRKLAPNSSDWFHHDDWLSFNSIQDTAHDQVSALDNDYRLVPDKPTWLYEPMYEGAIHTWGVRYQAYQTVLAGGFGHTYGAEILWEFDANWRQYFPLPGARQMAHLYKAVREMWTDAQFVSRQPDQDLIIGDRGKTQGRGWEFREHFETATFSNEEKSDRITAQRGRHGDWAMIYSADGRDVKIDLARMRSGRMDAYWFDPRTGSYWTAGGEAHEPAPFERRIATGAGTRVFNPPGDPGSDNDWLLILK